MKLFLLLFFLGATSCGLSQRGQPVVVINNETDETRCECAKTKSLEQISYEYEFLVIMHAADAMTEENFRDAASLLRRLRDMVKDKDIVNLRNIMPDVRRLLIEPHLGPGQLGEKLSTLIRECS